MKTLKRVPAKKLPAPKAVPLARKAAPVKAAPQAKAPAPGKTPSQAKAKAAAPAPEKTKAAAKGAPASGKAASAKAAGPAAAPMILAWVKDPESGLSQVERTPPTLSLGPLPLLIRGAAPEPGVYEPGTEAFRYWNASDSLRRAREMWKPHLPDNLQWAGGEPLEVDLKGEEEMSATFDRKCLSYWQGTVKGRQIHLADSPDVVAHEFGHAVLDALRPDLWDAALDEVAAFHEAFADITALLAALQLEPLCEQLLQETGGMLYQNSSLSRMAAQFGKAVHELNPCAAPPDCLRNAVNSLFYREPMHLPPMAPHTELSSDPHSFSRVLTGGFFEALAGMLRVHAAGPMPTVKELQEVARDAAALLAKAVRSSALSAAFFSEVAGQIIWADTALFQGKYDEVLRSAFVRRGLLSLEAVRSLKAEAARALNSGKPAHGADEMPRGRDMMMRATAYGLSEGALVVRTASFSRRGMIASAALDAGSTPVPGVEQATQSFLETLFRRGRVDFSQCKAGLSSVPHTHVKRKTHYLIEQNGQYHLRRRCFDEGFEDMVV